MNSFERMTATLNHQEPDRVPVYPILSGVTRHLVGADYPTWSTDADVCARAFLKSAEEFDIDCIIALIDLSVECDAWGQKIIFPENEAAHPDYHHNVIDDIDDYEKIKKVDYRTSKRMMMQIEVCRRLVEAKGGELPIVAFVFGPMGTLSMLRSQQEMYMDLYDDPDAVKGAIAEITATLKDYALALCDVGVDGIMFDTLFASGSIMSKAMWKEMEYDAVKELAAAVHDRGKMVMIHNCGEKIYFDVQIEAMKPEGISFLYPPDDCQDFAACKEKYGSLTTLMGCASPTNVVYGTDEEWADQCRAQIDAMAKGGGFVLATGCEYPANAPFDRARQMIDLAKTYGQYQK